MQPARAACDPLRAMLVELAIRNLALIESATLSFGGGLNVITGETGAGKSLSIDALELLLGQRARAGMVRKGADRASVEGRFLVADGGYGKVVSAWLTENLPDALEEGEGDELELILGRTLSRDGRTRAHVNHRPVTQRILRELTRQLVEIHGQNDHQKLFESGEQLRLLDTFGSLEDALAGYRERRERWLELSRRLESFEVGEAQRLERLDLLRFQHAELEEVSPSETERDDLQAEREVLRNAAELGARIGGLVQELSESESPVLDVLRRAERELDEWKERVPALVAPASAVREATAQLEDAVSRLVSFVDGIEANPARLEEVEERLSDLERLERKHRTDALGLVARGKEIQAEIEALESESQDRDQLTDETRVARSALAESARRLGRSRRGLRTRLRKAVEKGLAELGLAQARFEVSIAEREGGSVDGEFGQDRSRFGPSGADDVEFLLAANPGEERAPLRRVASGGEAARIMLALRGALAVRQSTPTLVFDEVDAGVGGRLGPKVGAHLEALASHHQILCVTHLPPIAAKALRHIRVHKEVTGGRTRTLALELADEARVDEIADMISGGAAHETARAEARRLLSP